MWNVLYLLLFVFFNEKSDHDVKLNWWSMIFISGVISMVFQKNTLCTSKICVIYFCLNRVNCCLKLFIYLFFGGGGRQLPPPLCCYCSSCTYVELDRKHSEDVQFTSCVHGGQVEIKCKNVWGTERAMNFDIPWNFIEEQLLHNFMKFFSGPWANQMVNIWIVDHPAIFHF